MAFDILIVDDSSTTRAIIKRILQVSGVPLGTLHEAANGEAGLAVLAASHVDLVLADLHMPVMDGAQMIRRMLADDAKKSIPVIVISAEPNEERIAELKDLGIRGYFRKPFTPEAVRTLVTETLGVQHA